MTRQKLSEMTPERPVNQVDAAAYEPTLRLLNVIIPAISRYWD